MKEISFAAGRSGRADVIVSESSQITRSQVEKMIRSGALEINGQPIVKPSHPLQPGDQILLRVPDLQPTHMEAQNIPLNILYEDADLAVVYKPSGLTVHPGAGTPDGTLANALLYALDDLSGVGGVERPGIVHRIDKDTSGLLLVAKNDISHLSLSQQISLHAVDRAYLALAYGSFRESEFTIEGPIGRCPSDRKKMAIVPGGKPAVTRCRVLEQFSRAALLECTLLTGRTHQIRVHLTSKGHPLLGDPLYGPKKPLYEVEGGQLLHAFQIGFSHPATGERMLFQAPPEQRFQNWLERLRKESKHT